MLMARLAKRSRIWLYVGPVLALAIILTGFAALYPHDRVTAWGLLAGGLTGGTAGTILLALGRRRQGGLAGRLASGQGDERETTIARRAAAMGGTLTVLATVALLLLTMLHPISSVVALTIVMWTYLAGSAVSYVVISRRS